MKKEIKQAQIDALALEIFKEEKAEGTPVTMEEAQEMARMELNAKQITRYEKSDTPRKKTSRERKVDPTKEKIINCVRVLLEGLGGKVEPLTNETDLHFTFNGEKYSIKLTKHRPPKK